MIKFKEITERCLTGELSGIFIIQGDKNWHSSYLQRHTILGHEMPGQYVLGPGVIYNEIGQCISNEKTKIIDFIPDNMKNFKEIAEKCLAGELSGTFILQDGSEVKSDYLRKLPPTTNTICSYGLYEWYISDSGNAYGDTGYLHGSSVKNFIPDNIQEQIEIDIPEGKVPVMEQTENGVVITWEEKELTYTELSDKFKNSSKYINSFLSNPSSRAFYKKVEVLRKLTNIRNYFGKPSKENSDSGWTICINGTAYRVIIEQSRLPVFTEKEHAEQAIRMLGDELKYLFEPW